MQVFLKIKISGSFSNIADNLNRQTNEWLDLIFSLIAGDFNFNWFQQRWEGWSFLPSFSLICKIK